MLPPAVTLSSWISKTAGSCAREKNRPQVLFRHRLLPHRRRPITVERNFDELYELHDLVEKGPSGAHLDRGTQLRMARKMDYEFQVKHPRR
jgi:hypothetical protein